MGSLKEFIEKEGGWLALLGVVFAFVVIQEKITISRAELLIMLFGFLMIRERGEAKRWREDFDTRLARLEALPSSNPGSGGAGSEQSKGTVLQTLRKANIVRGLIGAAVVGLVSALLGFLVGGLSDMVICGVIGAAIGEQIGRNKSKRIS